MRRRGTGFWFSVSLALSLLVIWVSGPENVLGSLQGADLALLGLAFILANIPLVVNSFIWQRILATKGVSFSIMKTLRYVLAGVFFNNLTPAGYVGGEPFVSYFVARVSDLEFEEAFSTVFSADTISFLPIISFLVAGLLLNPSGPTYLFLLPFLVSGAIFFLWFRNGWVMGFLSPVLGAFGLNIDERIKNLLESLRSVPAHGKQLAGLFAVAHLGYFMEILSLFLISLSLGLSIPLSVLLFVAPLSRLANYSPTPGGSGTYELTLAGLLYYFGSVGFADAVVVATLYRVVTYYFGILAGSLAFSIIPGRVRR